VELVGKVALVTGAAHGIGRAVAQVLAREGCAVAVHYRTSAAEAEALAAALRAGGRRARAIRADVTVAAEVEALVAEVEETLGGLDILVNNAGIVHRVGWEALDEAAWRRMLDVNLTGAFLCARAAVPAMRRRGGGAVVNVASMRGLIDGGAPHYAVAKAGLLMLTKTLAVALAPTIRVNAVAPGYTETRQQQHLTVAERERILARIPLGRFAEPEEIARGVLFLVSPRAAYITGQTLVMDGGVSMW